MATANPSNSALALSDAQIKNLRFASCAATIVLLVLGVAKAVTSAITIGSTPLLALLGLAQGGLLVLSALILIKISTDLRYAREAPSLNGLHLMNALDSWQDLCKTLIGVGVVTLLAALLRLSM